MEARSTNRKLLGEFLLEQQEPFALEAFLLERGCSRSLLNGSFVKRRKGVIRLSKLLRAIQHQIGLFNGSFVRMKRTSGCYIAGSRGSFESFSTRRGQGVGEEDEEDGLSSPCSTTVYVSCNESSDVEETPDAKHQDGLERDIQDTMPEKEYFIFPPENRQASPSCKTGYPAKPTEDSELSASLQDILLSCLNQQVAHSCKNSNSKKGAQQMMRLLLDCVMEAMETHQRKNKSKGRQNRSAQAAAEQIGKNICERVMEWGTTSRNGTSDTELAYEHFLDMEEEESWGECVNQRVEISSGIADGILGDLRDELLA